MPRIATNQQAALPPAKYLNLRSLTGATTAVDVDVDETIQLPLLGVAPTDYIDASGYNTLSLFVSVSGFAAPNSLLVAFNTVDPEVSPRSGIGGVLGFATLMTLTANGDYAATLYLPSYYATLSDDLLPFYSNLFDFTLTGGAGSIQIDDIKAWLTNA